MRTGGRPTGSEAVSLPFVESRIGRPVEKGTLALVGSCEAQKGEMTEARTEPFEFAVMVSEVEVCRRRGGCELAEERASWWWTRAGGARCRSLGKPRQEGRR